MAARERLTPKQQRFIHEYLVDFNGTQAAIRAGYSADSACAIAVENLRKPLVRASIDQALAELLARADVSASRVLAELVSIGYSNYQHYIEDDAGNLVLAPGAPPMAAGAVASVKRKRRVMANKDGEPIVETELEYRLWDKNTALTNLAKHLKLLVDRVEASGPDGAPVPVQVYLPQKDPPPT